MPHDPHLADLMREALADRLGVTERRMFGGYCWMLHGNMLCGVEVGRFMFRVGKALAPEALARPGAAPVSFGGRVARGLVWVDADACLDEGLDRWIGFAAQFVSALPPK
jgi:TfoX/Sxy family transcriptional regulator of competence genes